MTSALSFIVDMIRQLISVLSDCTFDMFGFEVNLMAVFVAILVIALVISTYWRGAKA